MARIDACLHGVHPLSLSTTATTRSPSPATPTRTPNPATATSAPLLRAGRGAGARPGSCDGGGWRAGRRAGRRRRSPSPSHAQARVRTGRATTRHCRLKRLRAPAGHLTGCGPGGPGGRAARPRVSALAPPCSARRWGRARLLSAAPRGRAGPALRRRRHPTSHGAITAPSESRRDHGAQRVTARLGQRVGRAGGTAECPRRRRRRHFVAPVARARCEPIGSRDRIDGWRRGLPGAGGKDREVR